MQKEFKQFTFKNRLKSMLDVDIKRLFISPFFYILVGISFAIPVLILVMTTMMQGTTPTNPQTGLPGEPMESFDYVWQILGSLSSTSSDPSNAINLGLTTMCNINMMFFAIAVLVCIFISEDFRSGYAKNIFTIRSKKSEYVISKNVVCFIGSSIMLIAFFIGSALGGAIANLPFSTDGVNGANVLFCMLSKIFLAPVFVSIFSLMSIIAKQKSWLSICLSLGVGMLLFMMIPSLTPLDANIINPLICLLASTIFSVGLGAISNLVLRKSSLV